MASCLNWCLRSWNGHERCFPSCCLLTNRQSVTAAPSTVPPLPSGGCCSCHGIKPTWSAIGPWHFPAFDTPCTCMKFLHTRASANFLFEPKQCQILPTSPQILLPVNVRVSLRKFNGPVAMSIMVWSLACWDFLELNSASKSCGLELALTNLAQPHRDPPGGHAKI